VTSVWLVVGPREGSRELIDITMLKMTMTPLFEKSASSFVDISKVEDVISSTMVLAFGVTVQCANVVEITLHLVAALNSDTFACVLPIIKWFPSTTTVVEETRDKRMGLMRRTVGSMMYSTVTSEDEKSYLLFDTATGITFPAAELLGAVHSMMLALWYVAATTAVPKRHDKPREK
jgi:hypothetical protein